MRTVLPSFFILPSLLCVQLSVKSANSIAEVNPEEAICVTRLTDILPAYRYKSTSSLHPLLSHCHPLVSVAMQLHDRIFAVSFTLVASCVGIFIAVTLSYGRKINPTWKFFVAACFVILVFSVWTAGKFFRTVYIGEHVEEMIAQLPEMVCPLEGEPLAKLITNYDDKDALATAQKCATYFYQFKTDACKADILDFLTKAATMGMGHQLLWKQYLAEREVRFFSRDSPETNADRYTLMYHFDSIVLPCMLRLSHQLTVNLAT